MLKKQIEKKIILITGTSSGFGLLTAARLASKGHNVIATMRNLNKKNELLNETSRRGCQINLMQMDVTDDKSIENTINQIAEEYGYLDVLINNAGYGIGGFFEDLSEKNIRDIFETNFFGLQKVTRKVIPLMRPRKKGKIINISSTAGFSSSPCFGAYNATKWAIEGFSESLQYELDLFGIQVLLIEPGPYKTKIFSDNAHYAENFQHVNSPYFELSKKIKEKFDGLMKDIYKDPEDVAILAEKLINTRKPKFRNIPDIESKVLFMLKKILPFKFYSAIIKNSLVKKIK